MLIHVDLYVINELINSNIIIYLHDAVHVARVAEVVEAGVALSVDGYEAAAGLGQRGPLADPLVHVDLDLRHRLVSLCGGGKTIIVRKILQP